MTEKQIREIFEKMLVDCPEVLSPAKAIKGSPLGKNSIYKALKNGEIDYFLYKGSYLFTKDAFIDFLIRTANVGGRTFKKKRGRTMLEEFPEKLSGEQVRKILHIGKKKCAWMLNNGFIKCQNNGKKSRKYTVLKEDLLAFIDDSAKHPEKYITPYAAFSTAKEVKNEKRKLLKAGFPLSLPKEFRQWLEKDFADIPDALTVAQVIKITGYVKNSVNHWIRKGWLKSVQAQSGQIVPKVWLIDFYCGYGYSIGKMSDKHVRLMRRFFKGKGEK